MMAYFQDLSEKYSPNSLWAKYSYLKATFLINENIDISIFKQLIAFLKQKSKGYSPKKSQVLTVEQVLTFIRNAPNETRPFDKVILVMGVFGALRKIEMVQLTIENVIDKGSVILVQIPKTKTDESKSFTIIEEEELGALQLVRKYASLRPPGLAEKKHYPLGKIR
ncbi:hypothetical protein Zmor_021554 [Zophobas morio]|uniref:Uncharacterized protein n=1 Tax=Zophobas morio TaxID=2755281 RepID=A0AA38I6K3_9CUCU|nr:hypothetical protein Zmor_021554 [Zophobas morio]